MTGLGFRKLVMMDSLFRIIDNKDLQEVNLPKLEGIVENGKNIQDYIKIFDCSIKIDGSSTTISRRCETLV